MRVDVVRHPAGAIRNKNGKTDDEEFLDAVNRVVDNPPSGHFYQDMKFALAWDGHKLWQEIIVIYGEVPT